MHEKQLPIDNYFWCSYSWWLYASILRRLPRLRRQDSPEFLREKDGDEMQGYLFSRPLPPDEVAAMLRAQALTLASPLGMEVHDVASV